MSSGLGVGISTTQLLNQGIQVDIVEIDPFVYYAAKTYFNLPNPRRVYLQDGLAVLEQSKAASYNVILHDVFTGGSVPRHLFSLESLQLIKSKLKSNGILVMVRIQQRSIH
jgi:spermidine synthase